MHRPEVCPLKQTSRESAPACQHTRYAEGGEKEIKAQTWGCHGIDILPHIGELHTGGIDDHVGVCLLPCALRW